MMDNTALYYDQSVLRRADMEKLTLSLILFSRSVYLHHGFRSEDDDINRRLEDMCAEGLIVPWAYPYEPCSTPQKPWSQPEMIRVVDAEAYRGLNEAVRERVAEYRNRTETTGTQERLTELVQLSNELWGLGLAGYFASERILAGKYRERGMFDRIARADYEETVAARLLELQGVTGGLADLLIEDILHLRETYQHRVFPLIKAATDRWPPEVSSSTRERSRAVDELMKTYSMQVEEYLKRRRPKGVGRVVPKVAVDVLAIILWPVGLWSIGEKIKDWHDRKIDLPLQWFLIDTKAMIKKRRKDND